MFNPFVPNVLYVGHKISAEIAKKLGHIWVKQKIDKDDKVRYFKKKVSKL